MTPGRHRCRRDNRVPDPHPRAAHRFTPLTFGQADDKPPSSVQDRERAGHDKENGFVHAWINVGQAGAGNAIKRRGELIFV